MSAPIVQAAFSMAGGAAVALRTGLMTEAAWWALFIALGAGAFLLRQRAPHALSVLFAALGCALGSAAGRDARADCRVHLADGTDVVAVGRFTTLPDSGARALLHASSLQARDLACGDVVVRVDLDESLRSTDHVVRVHGTWLRWGDAAVVRPERAGMVRATRVTPLDEQATPGVRERMQLEAQRRTRNLYGPDAPLVEALLLARTETLPRDVRARFAESGLVHLLAISGTHVALILGVLLVLAHALRLRGGAARACALTGAVAYVLFLGAPAPALRAALQLCLLSLGRALQRPTDARGALAVAALVLVTLDPAVVLDAGAQLSFAGVGGIVAFAPALERLLARVPRSLARPLAAGIAASATTLPIAGLHFGTLAPIGILAGLPGIPVTAGAVPAAALPIFLSFVSDAAAEFLVPAAAINLHALDRIAAFAAAVPGGHGFASAGDVHALLIAAAAAILALRLTVAHLTRRRSGARVRHSAAAVLLPGVAAGAAAVCILSTRASVERVVLGSAVEVHMIDVGQGDAIAIRSPRSRWVLVDAGPRGRTYDAGAVRVVPYLARRHVRELAALIVTHPDADHIGGAASAVTALDVHAVLEPAQPGARAMYVATLDAARRRDARWVVARAGTHIEIDGVTLDVIHPRAQVDAHEGANDYSAVVLLRFGTFRALLLGDAPTAAEDRLAARYGGGLRAQLIKVGHHGSATSTGERLLDAAAPALAIISVGRRNRYGHPAADVLARLARNGVRVVRTDERGAIVVRSDARGKMRVVTER